MNGRVYPRRVKLLIGLSRSTKRWSSGHLKFGDKIDGTRALAIFFGLTDEAPSGFILSRYALTAQLFSSKRAFSGIFEEFVA